MKILKLIALPLLMLPLVGSTCSKEKLVTLSIGFPTIAQFIAAGEVNEHLDTDIFGTDEVDVKNDIDIEGELESAGIDPQTLDDDAVKVIQIFYRIVRPDPEGTREIRNGALTVEEVDPAVPGPPVISAAGFTAPAGAATDWIDITGHFTDPGIAYFNEFLADCLREIKGTATAPPRSGLFKYTVSGDSFPADVDSDFVWEIKIVFQGTFEKKFDVIFGA